MTAADEQRSFLGHDMGHYEAEPADEGWEIKRRIGWVSPELQLYYQRDLACQQVVCAGFFDSIGVYQAYTPAQAAAARAAGKQVWWYICCGPHPPYANMFIEYPAIDGRLLMGAMTARQRPDGFLYYQISIWNSEKPIASGPFTDWTPHLERAAGLAFDWVYVNPIQKPGASGSLYSIADYFGFNPEFVDQQSPLSEAEQFKGALATAHKLGMSVLVDLVINHCAYDSPLVSKEPRWFLRENGQVQHPFCMQNNEKVFWFDLAQFDHQQSPDPEGLYRYFTSVIEHLISLGVDGFRCDAAYQIPRRLWSRLITDTRRRHPAVLFVAETLCLTAGNREEAAKMLGIGERTLYRKIKEFGL